MPPRRADPCWDPHDYNLKFPQKKMFFQSQRILTFRTDIPFEKVMFVQRILISIEYHIVRAPYKSFPDNDKHLRLCTLYNVHPSTDQHRPVQSITAQCSPVQSQTSQLQPKTSEHRQSSSLSRPQLKVYFVLLNLAWYKSNFTCLEIYLLSSTHF